MKIGQPKLLEGTVKKPGCSKEWSMSLAPFYRLAHRRLHITKQMLDFG
jgi:hypothetical protein